ncbi:DNA primase [Demequina sp. B12]|uniref:DNA primase n=1 Tax=Demequina sp. B12 TaxID=2992757 RepID=UPI00237C39CD|nr:DNA primase [Demequina sp. B12]MDE0572879.1 DNA primase [Demequina sp. B12]
MAGTINREDIASVRERAPIEDIIGQHVALKSAGVGSLKGLCPFHDERTPSFHVRPGSGRWHCFGCGEGGDVIEFIMRIDGLPFAEAVEYLADRTGITLRYEAGGGPRREGTAGQRKRLLEAHRVAQEFFAEQLSGPEARIGRDFLRERGFDRAAAEHFGVGYSPQGWNHLTDYLQTKGFTQDELRASGLVSDGQRGIYDRFRGRLMWPIRDVTGEVIGFGARRLHDDDQGPKYLNTPETPLYKKNQVLYGIDLAKGTIRAERTTIVVEGYTDVMACHLAGITNAVATCGTAFGEEHVKVVRRLMGDTVGGAMKVGTSGAKVIFTFDGDEAGQNAALKSFELDQQFLAQTFVAVDPEGKDPCDLRMAGGDAAVQALLQARVPLFEFVIKTALSANDLETPEGRAAALRVAAPVVAGIRDRAIQPEYARRLAGWLGMDLDIVRQAVTRAAKQRGGAEPAPHTGALPQVSYADAGVTAPARPDRRDPVVRAEALSLGTLLQAPAEVVKDPLGAAVVLEMRPDAYSVPQYRAIFEAILAAGGPSSAGPDWANDVAEQAGESLTPTISELSVSPLPHDKPETIGHYAGTVLARVLDLSITRQIAELRGRMQRAGAGTEAAQEAFAQIIQLETRRRQLREN